MTKLNVGDRVVIIQRSSRQCGRRGIVTEGGSGPVHRVKLDGDPDSTSCGHCWLDDEIAPCSAVDLLAELVGPAGGENGEEGERDGVTRPEDLRLRSDFRESYDHHFAGRHRTELPVWERLQATSRTRQQDHAILAQVGFSLPRTGHLWTFPEDVIVVAYEAPRAHRGEGKRLGAAGDLLRDGADPTTYCSEWIRGGARSLRVCWVGNRFFCWSYNQKQPDEWCSNVGDVEIESEDSVPIALEDAAWFAGEETKAPLLAVDLVKAGDLWLAIDLATAPGLRGCPGLPPWREVAELVAARWGELWRQTKE